MAQIQKSEKGGYIIWDESDWKAGVAPQGTFDSLSFIKQVVPGAGRVVNADPFRNYGFIQPGPAPIDATNSTTALTGVMVAGIIDAAFTNAYGVDVGGRVQQYVISTNTVTNSGGTFPHTITGTAPVGQDTIVYKHNFGGTTPSDQKFSLFYTYYNNANWDVGAYVNFTTFDDDFMSTVPATPLNVATDGNDVTQRTAPHSFCVGSDDLLYIGSGRYVHAYDGATGNNGTFYSKVLTLPQGFQIIGMVKYNDTLLIAGNYYGSTSATSLSSGEAFVYVWNYIDLDITQVTPLNDPYVSSIFIWRGDACVTTYGTYGARGQVKVKKLVGNSAVKIVDMPLSLPPVLRGVDSASSTLYINGGGKVITVGNKMTDDGTEVNYISSCSTTNTNGWIKNIDRSGTFTILISSSQATTYKLSKIDIAGTLTSVFNSQYINPIFPYGKRGQIKNVTVDFKNTVTPDDAKQFIVSLRTDFGNGADVNAMVATGLVVPIIKKFNNTTLGVSFPAFNSVALQLTWSNTSTSITDWFIVSRVVAEYELLDYNEDIT